MHRALFLLLGWGLALRVAALAPSELLLLVNQNSPRSLELANRYAALRGIPPENIVYLDLPESVLAPAAEIAPADFTRHIWQPLDAALHARHLLGRILAAAYSADFPIRVTTTPPMSLTGLTFTRNQIPSSGLITTGSYRSVFFAGPVQANGPTTDSRSLAWFRAATPKQLLPLPAMLLAYTGARGLEPDEIFQALEKTAQSVSKPWKNAAVYFITSDDIRSQMRAWQFPAAQAELAALGMPAIITNTPPAPDTPVLGLMCGTAWPATLHAAFAPGAYADHCTSFGALFHTADQTKLTIWPHAGAALTSGTISEPFSIWTKFPNARFFAHQIRGCSAIECFALSTACPFQLLPVGDPLAAPFAPPLVAQLGVRATGQQLAALLNLAGASSNAILRYSFFLDGRCVEYGADRPGLILNTAEHTEGYHRLLAVATCGDEIRFAAQAAAGFTRQEKGRVPILTGLKNGERIAGETPLRLQIAALTNASEVGVFQGERLLTRGTERTLTLDPARLGAGPVTLQAAAWYADGGLVRGAPLNFEIARATPSPKPAGFQALEKFSANFPNLGKLEITSAGTFAFSTTNTCALAVALASAREVAVTLIPTADSLTKTARAGLVFNVRDEKNFDFFGLIGETSGWTLAHMRDGVFHVIAARGAPVRIGASYRLGVRATASGLECLVNREQILCDKNLKLETAPLGLGVSGPGAMFAGLAVIPSKEKL